MNAIFQSILEISIFMSVVIMLVGACSRFFGKRYGVKWRYFLWLVIALRLVLPINAPIVQMDLPFGIEQEILAPAQATDVVGSTSPLPISENHTVASDGVDASVATGGQRDSPTRALIALERETQMPLRMENMVWLWGIGVAIYILYQGQKHFFFLRMLRRNSRRLHDARVLELYYDLCDTLQMHRRAEIYICRELPSPLCTGFFKQRIFINQEEMEEESLTFILKHELMHCKRHDIWYKGLLMVATGLHFFNPLVHWMARMAERDMEYSCDRAVLENCDDTERASYGMTILESIRLSKRQGVLSTAFWCRKEELIRRLEYIFDKSVKKRGGLLFLALALVILLGTALVGCGRVDDTQAEAYLSEYEAQVERLHEGKHPYIGNHVNVGTVFGALPLPQGISQSTEGMELFTAEEPYGARRYLVLEKDAEMPAATWFDCHAMIFLALIDNASFLEYSITDSKGEETLLHFERADAKAYFGDLDLRSMAVDLETFRSFIADLKLLFAGEENDTSLQEERTETDVLLDALVAEFWDGFSYEQLIEDKKYHQLIKLGDTAATEILNAFAQGQPHDVRGKIMLVAAHTLLYSSASGDLETIVEEITPAQWLQSYYALDSMILKPFGYDASQTQERQTSLTLQEDSRQWLLDAQGEVPAAVYQVIAERLQKDVGQHEICVFAPLVYHVAQEEDHMSVYAVIGETNYRLLNIKGYRLEEAGGSSIPTRLDFEKVDGKWQLTAWTESGDGTEYAPSIREMCADAEGVADKLIYYDQEELQRMELQNLLFYLEDMEDMTVYSRGYMDDALYEEINRVIPYRLYYRE